MNTFPTIGTVDREASCLGYEDYYQQDTVRSAPFISGYPFMVQTRSFDPLTTTHRLIDVSDADKATIRAFYEANKDTEFWWLNPGDLVYYSVKFDEPLHWRANDDTNSWTCTMIITQTSSLTMEPGDYGYGEYGAGPYGQTA